MDDSTQDRAAHTPGIEGSLSLKNYWRDDCANMPVQFTVTRPDGTPHAVEMTVAEWVRMADSHADLLAALEGLLADAIILSDEYLAIFDRSPMDATIQGWDKARWMRASASAKRAHAALAKARGATP